MELPISGKQFHIGGTIIYNGFLIGLIIYGFKINELRLIVIGLFAISLFNIINFVMSNIDYGWVRFR